MKPWDIILFGATGFTGQLLAEQMRQRQGVRWAMAGRDLTKLRDLHQSLGLGTEVGLLVVDATNKVAVADMVSKCAVVVSTVGPYQRHGEVLVRACAELGTDYLDLCGEPAWMARMIPELMAPATQSGARIVFSCGFDSLPFDLGVWFLQREAMRRWGAPLQQVRGRVLSMKGQMSGGTMASALATMEAMAQDPAVARVMRNPFALTPGYRGAAQPDLSGHAHDETVPSWTAPFVMAPINTKTVHRTHALLGHPWGNDFTYDERLCTGEGASGERRAKRQASAQRWQNMALAWSPTRWLLQHFFLPKPGEGPDEAARLAGRYDLRFWGATADGQRTLSVRVKGDRDPGYGSTSKMLAEAACCVFHLPKDGGHAGGVWTAGALCAEALVTGLQARAGLSFEVEAQP